MVSITAVRWFSNTLSKQTVTADADGIPCDFHGKQLLLLDVVVDGSSIYIDDLSGTGDPDYLYILSTALTPNLFSKDKRRLYFNHDGSLLFFKGKAPGSAPEKLWPCMLKSFRFPAPSNGGKADRSLDSE